VGTFWPGLRTRSRFYDIVKLIEGDHLELGGNAEGHSANAFNRSGARSVRRWKKNTKAIRSTCCAARSGRDVLHLARRRLRPRSSLDAARRLEAYQGGASASLRVRCADGRPVGFEHCNPERTAVCRLDLIAACFGIQGVSEAPARILFDPSRPGGTVRHPCRHPRLRSSSFCRIATRSVWRRRACCGRSRATSLQIEQRSPENRLRWGPPGELQQLELKKKAMESEIAAATEQMGRYRSQQLQVRKNDEYQALGGEITRTQSAIGTLEGQELEVMYAIDEARRKVTAAGES